MAPPSHSEYLCSLRSIRYPHRSRLPKLRAYRDAWSLTGCHCNRCSSRSAVVWRRPTHRTPLGRGGPLLISFHRSRAEERQLRQRPAVGRVTAIPIVATSQEAIITSCSDGLPGSEQRYCPVHPLCQGHVVACDEEDGEPDHKDGACQPHPRNYLLQTEEQW